MIVRGLLFLLLLGATWIAAPAPSHADEAVWQRLRAGGHAILIRHAEAPGTGDPSGFKLEDCATQRNLSASGRDQARRIGAALKANGIRIDQVLSSRWCRALDTARLMESGTVEPFAALDSFFSDRSVADAQTAAVMRRIAELGGRTVVMVTHQVNITRLTGVYPRSGEMVVVKHDPQAPAGLTVIGRIPTNIPGD